MPGSPTLASASRTPGLRWRWSEAARGACTGLPAAIAAVWNVQLAAALAVGLIPVCAVPLAPHRRARVRSALFGILAAASILLGGIVAQWPIVAVVAMAGAGGLLGRVLASRPLPAAMVGLTLCLPLLAVGFSYPGVDTVAPLAGDIVLGTVWSTLVALAWAEHEAPPTGPQPSVPPDLMRAYGWVVGLVGAACAAIGFAADLEHVGWAPTAALLVMRPVPPQQRLRSVGRLADVVLGAAAAVLLVLASPAAWVYGVAIGLVVTAATATAGSRWYVLPTFTTYLVFVMLLAHDPTSARSRFWERVAETGVGVGVAALAAFVVLPALRSGGVPWRRR
ncbi:FUSC family protein [Nocardioides sp. Iso805N]|uniref:FUSC family protein n=1 Tax=Nocardioides sp. Iso805N TaxID=1283287 RepID=UPI00036BAB38|nr:FUSC family protein [Nocardioides sp. Iso805N]